MPEHGTVPAKSLLSARLRNCATVGDGAQAPWRSGSVL